MKVRNVTTSLGSFEVPVSSDAYPKNNATLGKIDQVGSIFGASKLDSLVPIFVTPVFAIADKPTAFKSKSLYPSKLEGGR